MDGTMECVFAVKEGPKGEPFIVPEPRGLQPGVFGQGLFSLDLRDGASLEIAQQVAEFLNEHVGSVTYTDLRGK